LTNFNHKFGSVFEGMNEERVSVAFGYHYLQMVRAILISTSVVFMKALIYQIFSIVFYTLATLIYVGLKRPFDDSLENSLTLFNEFMVLVMLYHMISFTDFIDKPETISMIGYSLNGCLALVIGVNLIIILTLLVKEKLRMYRLRKIRRQNLKKLE